jgi:predicted PurR-regulated permease PerM
MNGPDVSEERPAGSGAPSLTATVVTLAVLAVFLYFIRLILIPFVFAGAVAFVLSIVIDFLAARTGLSRKVIAPAIFLLLLGSAVAFGVWVYPSVSGEFLKFATDLKGALTEVFKGIAPGGHIKILGQSYSPDGLADKTQAILREWIEQPGNLLTVVTFGFSGIFAIFLSAVILFYFLIEGRSIIRSLVRLAPPEERPLISDILAQIGPILKRYFLGVAIIATYAGVAAYVGLGLILGVHHAVLLAMSTGLLEMLPVAGPLLAAVLAGIVALQRATSAWYVFEYVIYASALRLSIDQLFGPIILGRAASLSPVTIIFCFLSGGLLYGIAGVILSVPVALSIRIALRTIYGDTEGA